MMPCALRLSRGIQAPFISRISVARVKTRIIARYFFFMRAGQPQE